MRIVSAGSFKNILENILSAFSASEYSLITGPSIELLREYSKTENFDILIHADKQLPDAMNLHFPGAERIPFARNRMVLFIQKNFPFAAEIMTGDYSSLFLPSVKIHHSDPDIDPGGYRAVFVLELLRCAGFGPAADYNEIGAGFRKNAENPPAESDIIITYASKKTPENYIRIDLPDSLNLGSPESEFLYRKASYRVPAANSGKSFTVRGSAIQYEIILRQNADLNIKYFYENIVNKYTKNPYL